jgi:C-terminal processing protease CtpA/Prc
MYRKALFVGVVVVSGVVAGAVGTSVWTWDTGLFAGPAAVSDNSFSPQDSRARLHASDSGNLPEVLESLTRVLDREIDERRVLAEKLDALDSELSDLKRNLKSRVEEAFVADTVQQQSPETIVPTTEDPLEAAGFTRQQLDAVRRLQAEAQMAAIAMDDRARREGWVDTPRYYQEARSLASGAAGVREALGDDLYDRYLIASGMPNRVAVGSIIETSPAERAGFRPGDVIVRYGGENIYSSEQLNELRSSGTYGQAVAVEVLRNGQSLQLTIPRGPMGVATAPTFIDPAAPPE